MKLSINITRKNGILAGIVAVISVLAHFLCGISVFNMFLFSLLFFVIINIKLEFHKGINVLLTAAAIMTGSILTTGLMQYLLLVEDLRDKISDEKFWLNVCCVVCVYLVIFALVNHLGYACMAAHIGLMIFAGINYFVYAFRGNELSIGDFKSIGTGLSVALNYDFSLNAQAMNSLLATILFVAGVGKLNIKFKKHIPMRIICFSFIILCSVLVAEETEATVTETWEQKGTYKNGYLLNFVLGIRDSFVEKPKLYSYEFIEHIEDIYRDRKDFEGEKKPTIIAVMNESFADLRVVGELKTNQPVMPFLDSLSENTIKGYALSSIYGAKTPNSEWEFLTGNSMAYLPVGSVPYQQYLEDENAYTFVDTLKQEEYTCVAMHPYYASGWSRDSVYPKMGFDETYFLEDFDQTSLMRKYVSDSAMYKKLIERYEAKKEGENLFIMGVTMQNHGGYKEDYENFSTDVAATDFMYADVNQYLSLAHQSDMAVKELVEYFQQQQEPVVICFFGDHQPSLTTSFYKHLNGKGLSGLSLDELEELFCVPFFIWTNYESESKTVERTSINFLSLMVFEKANLPLSSYQEFLSDFMEEIPSMNVRGYYSKSKGKYVRYGKGSREEEIWLERYKILQYNGLFDEKKKSEVFFNRSVQGLK